MAFSRAWDCLRITRTSGRSCVFVLYPLQFRSRIGVFPDRCFQIGGQDLEIVTEFRNFVRQRFGERVESFRIFARDFGRVDGFLRFGLAALAERLLQ